MSIHNLVFGTLYLDIGDTMTIRNLKTREYSITKFTRRGWMNKEANAFKVEGYVYTKG